LDVAQRNRQRALAERRISMLTHEGSIMAPMRAVHEPWRAEPNFNASQAAVMTGSSSPGGSK
jgi:hypothetical protein